MESVSVNINQDYRPGEGFPFAYLTIKSDDVVGTVRRFGFNAEVSAKILAPNLDRPWAVVFNDEFLGGLPVRVIVEGN